MLVKHNLDECDAHLHEAAAHAIKAHQTPVLTEAQYFTRLKIEIELQTILCEEYRCACPLPQASTLVLMLFAEKILLFHYETYWSCTI
jgi:hypothetical protein